MKIILPLLLLTGSLLAAIPPGMEPEHRGTQPFPCVMVRYSTPIKVSGVLGVSFNRMRGYRDYSAFFVQLEPGFGGGKINLGYRLGHMEFLPLWNAGVSASVLRTWSKPLGSVQPDQTYAGLELSGSLVMLGASAGVFRHIGGDDTGNRWIYTLGVGMGF